MTKVSLLILHFKSKKLTAECLASVEKLSTANFRLEAWIVNNNPDHDLDFLARKHPRFRFLKTDHNLGFVGGNNFGLSEILKNKPDWVFLVNNDTVLDKNLVNELLEAGQKDPAVGIIGPKIYFAPGFEFHAEKYKPVECGRVIWYAGGLLDRQNVYASHRGVDEVDQGQFETPSETDFVSGCGMFIRTGLIDKIGLLDKRYFMYLEDVDYCERARRAGFRVVFEPKGLLWHANAASSAVGGDLHDYFLTRNRLLFGSKFASARTKLALVRESVKMLVSGRPWQKIGARDFYLRRFGRGSWREK